MNNSGINPFAGIIIGLFALTLFSASMILLFLALITRLFGMKKTSAFFQKLGIGVSDLIKESLKGNGIAPASKTNTKEKEDS